MSALEQLMARARDVRADDVDADGIRVLVREPTASVHSRYAVLWTAGRDLEAVAHLLLHCVVDEQGKGCLTPEQAQVLAAADASLTRPIVSRILEFVTAQKKPDASAADGVPDQPAAGAATQ